MSARTDYPHGVPCWVDIVEPDFDTSTAFYGQLFGWSFDVRTPDDAPVRYAYARLDGTVGGVGSAPEGQSPTSGWTHYVAVDSVDDTVAAVEANGGKVIDPPGDVPGAGRSAVCADPEGAVFGLWQGAENRGAEAVNGSGMWVLSELNTDDPEGAERFYRAVFGWERGSFGPEAGVSGFWRLPGYGKYLADSDPEIREAQATEQGPEGWFDAVAIVQSAGALGGDAPATPRWTVTFGVASADEAYARALELGATAVTPLFDTPWTRQATIRDPQGAELTISEYRPPQQG